jgi:hypothetical protein
VILGPAAAGELGARLPGAGATRSHPPGASQPVWEEASVKLPDHTEHADSIVRMKVIEWGTVGVDMSCQVRRLHA